MADESASSAWRQLVETGMQVTEMTRSQAQRLVKQLVKEGQVAEERARTYVDELVARSRRRTEELTQLVRREVGQQAAALGLATRADLERLEKRLTTQLKKASSAPRKAKAASKKSGGSKSSGSSTTKK